MLPAREIVWRTEAQKIPKKANLKMVKIWGPRFNVFTHSILKLNVEITCARIRSIHFLILFRQNGSFCLEFKVHIGDVCAAFRLP